jgi:type IV pilus assembly protein PilE
MRPARARRAGKGFALIELLVLMAIIGILAVLAVTSYFYFRKKAMTVEAKVALINIRKLEKDFHDDHGRYSDDLSLLGFRIDGSARYAYDIPTATVTTFLARARGNLDDDAILDTWTMDQGGNLVQLVID